jgi:hypothetical protein
MTMPGTIRLVLAVALLGAVSAHAQTADCIDVKSVGYQINSPGIYCLRSPLAGSGILIEANDVVLDLNGYAVELPAGSIGPVINVRGVSGVTIRNGRLRGGRYGVIVSHGSSVAANYLVERLHVERSAICGICVQGDGGVVRDNIVTGVGSSPFGGRAGISVNSGSGVRVNDNHVIDMVVNPGQVDGISVADAPGAVIERNVVSNAAQPASSGYPMGIHLYKSSTGSSTPMRTIVAGNRIVNMQTGISNRADASLFMDNVVGNATLPFSGGVMAGTSNYSF